MAKKKKAFSDSIVLLNNRNHCYAAVDPEFQNETVQVYKEERFFDTSFDKKIEKIRDKQLGLREKLVES